MINELNKKIETLNLDSNIINKLKSNNINTINDLWQLTKTDLKNINIKDSEINSIIIKLQLMGISLNKKINVNDKIK